MAPTGACVQTFATMRYASPHSPSCSVLTLKLCQPLSLLSRNFYLCIRFRGFHFHLIEVTPPDVAFRRWLWRNQQVGPERR